MMWEDKVGAQEALKRRKKENGRNTPNDRVWR
jgi:hypothetical protein